jgi:ABC-type amino acid transport substrate-binding protein
VDKAPRTPGGKFTMLGHGFYMLIMISSYVANLASVLSQRDTSMDLSGWYEGNKPVIARIEDIELAIPARSSQVKFIQQEEAAEGRKFMKIDCYETWEESMDAVLCGEAPAAFHDEAMVLYYLNSQMERFGAGEYVPRVGNCDSTRNPHELQYWGIGKR